MTLTLGRGLSALFGENSLDHDGTAHETQLIPLGSISPNPNQPRQHFLESALDELVSSIKEKGVLQPIIVRSLGLGYEIIAGERRWRAAGQANLTAIQAIVIQCNDEDALTLGLVENLQREDLNPIEEADSLCRLTERFGKTQEEVGRMIGKSRFYVSNMMRLLSLPESAKKAIQEGKISASHARALLKVDGNIEPLIQKIMHENMSVRAVENLVKKKRELLVSPAQNDATIIAQRLSETLGLPISIHIGTLGEGNIRVNFYDLTQLENLVEKLGG